MSARKTVLVGSIPAPDAEGAMRLALREVGPHLRYLPDGETGERDRWVVSIIEAMRAHPDLEVRKEGRWTAYDDQLNFAVRRGHRLRAEKLDLGYPSAYEESRPTFDLLRDEFDRPDLVYQVGVPGDLDLALFALGTTGPFRHRAPFTDATVDAMTRIHEHGGDDVLFQLEIPAELVFVTKAPGPLRRPLAGWLAGVVTRLAARAPEGARFGVHLCLGDLGHEALTRMRDAGPVTRLAGAIAARWPAGRPLEYLHAPLAAGEEPPVLEERFYRPLGELRLPEDTRFVAGLLHESRSVDELRQLLGLVESRMGSTVDVAAACGLGRRGEEAAVQVLRQGAALCGLARAESPGPRSEPVT